MYRFPFILRHYTFSLIKTPLKITCDIIIRVLTGFNSLLNDIKSRLEVENHLFLQNITTT